MRLENFNSGAGVPTLNQNHLHKLKIIIPSLPEQKQIAAILSAYDDLIENNNRRITILEKMTEELYREWFVRLRFPGHEKAKIVKGVPEGWEVKQITQIYRTSSGGTPSGEKSEYYGGSIPWVKTGELKNTFLIKTEEQITENALENSSAKIFPKHTIILAMYCAMGELSILSLDAATNQACCAFLPKYDYLSYPFSYHLIRNVRQSLINLSFGAAQQNLSQEIIKKFKILVPPQELIKKFSEVVLPVFKTIENFYIQNDRLKISRNRLLSRLMSGKIDAENMDIQFSASMQKELAHA
jgi:type I restriction enzyme S subunit